ncbi:MAG: ABC transporter permease subunit [Chitinivibrionales bacterium]|nr:ABC transporter permease subunit [Chitinivibrionales bacterium]
MQKIVKIFWYTVQDQLRDRSTFILLIIGVIGISVIRGCFGSHYSIQGKSIDSVTITWNVSQFAFAAITYVCMILAVLTVMGLFSKDKTSGQTLFYLSKPVSRIEYVCGRIAGAWIFISCYLLLLHGALFLFAYLKTKAVVPNFAIGSLLCTIDLFFCVTATALLSVVLPEIIAAIGVIGVIIIGFVSDGAFSLMKSPLVQNMVDMAQSGDIALWRIIWPKTSLLITYSRSLMGSEPFSSMGPINPVFNVVIYGFVCMALFIVLFRKKEI